MQNHAANLTVLPGGDLGCVWFGGTQEGVADICVWFSRLAPGRRRLVRPGAALRRPHPLGAEPAPVPRPRRASSGSCTPHRAPATRTPPRCGCRVSQDDGATLGPDPRPVPGHRARRRVRPPAARRRCAARAVGAARLPLRDHRPASSGSGDRDTSSVMISDDEGGTWREHAGARTAPAACT